jgi:hypothetical protein
MLDSVFIVGRRRPTHNWAQARPDHQRVLGAELCASYARHVELNRFAVVV